MVRVRDRATLHLNLGSEGGQREVQHGDELVILAAITLLKLCNLYVQEPTISGDHFVPPFFSSGRGFKRVCIFFTWSVFFLGRTFQAEIFFFAPCLL